jgi:ankyrin repeat protein
MDLVEAGASLTARDRFGFTALHYAAKGGRLEVLKRLVEVGADISMKTEDAKTPVAFAIDEGHDKCSAVFTRLGGFKATLEKVPEGEQYEGERNDPWAPKFNKVKEKKFWIHTKTGDIAWDDPYEVANDAFSDDNDDETGAVDKETWLQKRKQQVSLANMKMEDGVKFSWNIKEKGEITREQSKFRQP